MTDWTDITDTETAQDSPVTQSLTRALRDNVSALAEGASGAPDVTAEALAASSAMANFIADRLANVTLTAGSVPIWRQQTNDDVTKTYSAGDVITPIVMFRSGGTVRFAADFDGGSGDVRIYVNGVLIDTWESVGSSNFSTDVTVSAGDWAYADVISDTVIMDYFYIQSDNTDHIGQVVTCGEMI